MAEFLFNNVWVLVTIACMFFFAGAMLTFISMNYAWMIVGFIVATLTMFIDYIEPLKPKQSFTMSEISSTFDIHDSQSNDANGEGYLDGVTEYIVSHKSYEKRTKMTCNTQTSECVRDTNTKAPSDVNTLDQFSEFLKEPEDSGDDYLWLLIFLVLIVFVL